jgi:peroxiredoxin
VLLFSLNYYLSSFVMAQVNIRTTFLCFLSVFLLSFLASAASQKLYSTTQKTVLIFLSAKCPCSNSHISTIKNLHAKYQNFQFIAIHSNADETPEETNKYFAQVALPFKLIEDQNTELANQYKAYKTPHAFVLDNYGKILYQGGITNSAKAESADQFFLADALEDLQLERPVKTKFGRTLGCVIQRPNEKNTL